MKNVPEGKLGPHMKALNEKQRKFVVALLSQSQLNYSEAAERAGYKSENNDSLRNTAHRLAHDAKVLAAIQEESSKRLHAAVGMASERLVLMAQEPGKDQFKAITAVLNRGGLHEKTETRHTVDVGGDAKNLIARVAQLALLIGMDPTKVLGRAGVALPPPDPIDAEYTDLTPSTGADEEEVLRQNDAPNLSVPEGRENVSETDTNSPPDEEVNW